MGSSSDLEVMTPAVDVLAEFGVIHEVHVVSAHRSPMRMVDYAQQAAGRGLRVIIAGAGGAAHLPGMVAAMTVLPVIGVPVPTRHLGGADSLHSIVQMPSGVPVATMAIGGSAQRGAARSAHPGAVRRRSAAAPPGAPARVGASRPRPGRRAAADHRFVPHRRGDHRVCAGQSEGWGSEHLLPAAGNSSGLRSPSSRLAACCSSTLGTVSTAWPRPDECILGAGDRRLAAGLDPLLDLATSQLGEPLIAAADSALGQRAGQAQRRLAQAEGEHDALGAEVVAARAAREFGDVHGVLHAAVGHVYLGWVHPEGPDGDRPFRPRP